MKGFHLRIATPSAVLVDSPGVLALRAEDESGCFGILRGHADFVTVLGPSVIRWRDAGNADHFCAVRNGVLTARSGTEVSVACREGVLGDDLAGLEEQVRSMRAAEMDASRRAHVEQTRLHARAVRELMRHLRAARGDAPLQQADLSEEDLLP